MPGVCRGPGARHHRMGLRQGGGIDELGEGLRGDAGRIEAVREDASGGTAPEVLVDIKTGGDFGASEEPAPLL